jgi:hypothetical protein
MMQSIQMVSMCYVQYVASKVSQSHQTISNKLQSHPINWIEGNNIHV